MKNKIVTILMLMPIIIIFGITHAKAQNITNETISVPCIKYKNGMTWTYTSSNPNGTVREETMVKSIDGNYIRTVSMISTIVKGLGAGTYKSEQESTLLQDGDNIYRIGFVMRLGPGMQSNTTYDPPLPKCGTFPSELQVTSQSKMGSINSITKQHYSWKYLGKKEVKAPAGTFLTYVYQDTMVVSEQNSSVPVQGNSKIISTVYINKKVGLVRSENVVVTKLPDSSSFQHGSEEGALKGILNGVTSENVGKKLKQLKEHEESAPADQSTIKYVEQRSETSFELIAVSGF